MINFWTWVLKNFLGYFVFFVSPTVASDNWERYRNGAEGEVLSEREKEMRMRAFIVGLALGPILLFFGCILMLGVWFS